MWRATLLVLLATCGHSSAPIAPGGSAQVPRLLPPPPIEPTVRGASYLTTVAMQLQAGWGQFLDDCRLRLPASHALNQMALAVVVELAVDRSGKVVERTIGTSGNADFDRAVRDAISDAEPFAAPPAELVSDDDRVHLRWLFARDRRQAGPATAEIVTVELPLARVVERWVIAGELARAARRIASAPASADRATATEHVMVAALREAIASPDGGVRRAAIEAIGRARTVELASDVRGLLAVTSDTELRLAAIAAVAALGDRDAAGSLVSQLAVDLPEHARLALAETAALVALGRAADAAGAIRAMLDRDHASPHPLALQAFALAPVPELAPKLGGWLQSGDARTRAGVCSALAGLAPEVAAPSILRGLGDRDATVRATCARTAGARAVPGSPAIVAKLHALATDRDRSVRARAIAALVALDPASAVHAADDPAAEVRAAFATALAGTLPSMSDADLHVLIDDRDPDVRAAAWASLATAAAAPVDRAQLAARAAKDSAQQVRRAALAALDDDDQLARIAAGDDAPEVRTEALVQLAGRRGRAAVTDLLLGQLAAAAPRSADRVRTALAWLLAR
jgi:TonB family protein